MGMELEKVKDIRLHLNEGIAGKVASSQKSYFVPDTSVEPDFSGRVDKETGFVTKSIIAVPLVFQDATQGVIEIVNRIDGTPYTEADHLILQTIADFAAIALYNASLFDQLFVKVHYDPLTALYNRTRLNIEYERHNQNVYRERRQYDEKYATVIMIDLNDFKNINDSFGHLAGDSVLKDFAQKLKNLSRDTDLIFRIGGDEFLLIAYNNTENDGLKLKGRLIERISKLKKEVREEEIPYDFSFGIFSGHPLELETIIHQADMNMYENKKNG
jgi:diguanylate cyclase (GGDEF)-like protein